MSNQCSSFNLHPDSQWLFYFLYIFLLFTHLTYHHFSLPLSLSLSYRTSPPHTQRAVFHEITKEAILQSFACPRDIDMDLVQSQETRRILDRLAGFTVSPVVWRYISPGLSAGRVQSCGLHAVTEVRHIA